MRIYEVEEQLCLFDLASWSGKTCRGHSPADIPKGKTSGSSSKKSSELKAIPYQFLDLTPGAGNLLGESFWELCSPWRGGSSMLNTGPAPLNAENVYSLSQILEDSPPSRYYLSRIACLGILRRASERGKVLPEKLELALILQAGLTCNPFTSVSNPEEEMDGYDGELIAFAANQRDEVRDLHDVAGALGAQPGMKQQTFVARGCLNPWDTQQMRVFVPESNAPTLTGADGGGGRNPAGLLFAAGVVTKGNGDCFLTPDKHTSLTKGGGQAGQGYPCVFTAGFCAGAGPSAGGIGYTEEISPTLKAAESGTNMVPSILCLNDQGGSVMDCTVDVTGTLRAQEHGHQPLVMSKPELFENHGIDSRYTGPHPVAPTLSARAGTGGNNLPLALQSAETFCIAGNTIDRQPQNGGNGLGCQEDVAYTLTATDKHAVYQDTVGTLTSSDCKGPNNQYVSQDKCIVDGTLLIRRLTPMECERLQGFPDHWTDLPGASDSSRYKALGNSVAIPCVEYIMHGIALAVAFA